ncbi:MAG: phosphotransferase family protein [Acidimicrobiales bacterium]|nr:phosphotransferase family protein [Acidimicrobiales bacterium]
MSDIPGYDVAAVENWAAQHTSLVPPFSWERLEGGHSNLTYLIADTHGVEAVIRRPPEGELLPKAHDMGREFKIISALHGRGVPVATPHAYCEDPSVTGAHFYIMGKVGGRALYTADDVVDWIPVENRPRVGISFISTLATLHSLDPVDIGLGDLGRHDGYVQRQLRTWYGSWTSSAEAAEYDDARIHALHERFQAEAPTQGPARVVHGDFGLHNTMIDSDGSLVAVLDWEIATLGDPLADFAYSLNAWSTPASPAGADTQPPTTAEGMVGPETLVEEYQRITGADLSRLDFYRAFNYFKTACIIHGVYARYRRGQKSTEGIDMPHLLSRAVMAIDNAEAAASSM